MYKFGGFMPVKKHFYDPLSMEGDDEESAAAATSQGVPTLPDSIPTETSMEAAAPVVEPGSSAPLEAQFEDPQLYVGTEGGGQTNIIQETTEAIQELFTQVPDEVPQTTEAVPQYEQALDVQVLSLDASEMNTSSSTEQFVAPELSAAPELMETSSGLEAAYINQSDIASKLFSLVLCDYKFDVLVEEILKVVMSSVSAQVGSVLEYDPSSNEYFFRAAIGGAPDKVKAFRIPANKGIVGHVAESGQSMLINDVADDANHLTSISIAVGFQAKSCMAAPIMIANQLYGVVELFNKNTAQYFDHRDMQNLLQVLDWAGKVLEVRFFLAEIMKQRKMAA